jgi:hypothetical protein
MAFCNEKMENFSKIGKFCKIALNFDKKPLSGFTIPPIREGPKTQIPINRGGFPERHSQAGLPAVGL